MMHDAELTCAEFTGTVVNQHDLKSTVVEFRERDQNVVGKGGDRHRVVLFQKLFYRPSAADGIRNVIEKRNSTLDLGGFVTQDEERLDGCAVQMGLGRHLLIETVGGYDLQRAAG